MKIKRIYEPVNYEDDGYELEIYPNEAGRVTLQLTSDKNCICCAYDGEQMTTEFDLYLSFEIEDIKSMIEDLEKAIKTREKV